MLTIRRAEGDCTVYIIADKAIAYRFLCRVTSLFPSQPTGIVHLTSNNLLTKPMYLNFDMSLSAGSKTNHLNFNDVG